MRIELRDKPEEKKEPVAEVWLTNSRGGTTIYYSIDGGDVDSLAYFNHDEGTLTVFTEDLKKIGYRLDPYPEVKP